MPSISHQGLCRPGLFRVTTVSIRLIDGILIKLTEADTRVFLSHVVTLLVGEEHISGQATLGRVRIFQKGYQRRHQNGRYCTSSPFFFLPPSATALALVLRVAFSLGMVNELKYYARQPARRSKKFEI